MSRVVRPLELFYSYSHEDKTFRRKLEQHLRGLHQEGVIAAWHYEQITAGSDWSQEIREHLERADIVLFLVSSAFLDSDYCNNIELKRAMARHKAGKARVIPVILRNCAWKKTILRDFKALPSNGDAVIEWRNRDAAYTDVVEGISKVAEELSQVGKQSRAEISKAEAPRAEIAVPATVSETYRKYKDAGHAFSAARKRIEEGFEEPRRGRRELTTELKLLAIAMTQSWHFVSHDLPDILKNYPRATIRIQVLLSDPDFLDSLKLDTDFEHWAERCRQNIGGLKDLMRRPICTEGRLAIHLKTYKQIPHWHGLLVDRRHLFMGRAKWSFETAGPTLTVGQNFYRGYGQDSDRVALFEGWHRYYFDFYSDNVILPPAGNQSSLKLVRTAFSTPGQEQPSPTVPLRRIP